MRWGNKEQGIPTANQQFRLPPQPAEAVGKKENKENKEGGESTLTNPQPTNCYEQNHEKNQRLVPLPDVFLEHSSKVV